MLCQRELEKKKSVKNIELPFTFVFGVSLFKLEGNIPFFSQNEGHSIWLGNNNVRNKIINSVVDELCKFILLSDFFLNFLEKKIRNNVFQCKL